MILSLHIENVAIIKRSDIDFRDGFNVLTGETGAGKSIIIDSINLVLGNKGSRELISSGCDYAFVSAVFSNFSDTQIKFLSEFDVMPDEDGNILLSRKITKEGRSVSKINGIAVNVTLLKNIAPVLVSIHGQHDGSRLLNPSCHIDYLDGYCGIQDELNEYLDNYIRVKTIRARIDELTKIRDKRNELEESLCFKISELENANIKIGEKSELEAAKTVAKNNALIKSSLYNSEQILSGENSVLDSISQVINQLAPIEKIIKGVDKNLGVLAQVKAELEDVSEFVSRTFSDNDESYMTEDYIEERLYVIGSIIKKYGSEEDALKKLDDFKAELERLEENDNDLDEAMKAYSLAISKLESIAAKISAKRTEGAKRLAKEIDEQLKELDMPSVRFEVRISRNKNARGGNKYTQNGFDSVEFYISTNAGQEPKPIAKIASGGEMSRIMLCLKTTLNRSASDCSAIIYDEIDTGVSGATAYKIGCKLKASSEFNQVFCITHLAQIAALADHHYKVSKHTENGFTKSDIKLLDYSARVEEVARIIGGTDITPQIIKTADEMIKKSTDSN